LHCHEVWQYDDNKHIRKLIEIIPLCKLCHWVKHAILTKGRAGINVDFPQVGRQFMKVNKCSHKIFFSELDKAKEECEERSNYDWENDFGPYSELVQPFL
jgi:hypothetical protein